MRDKPSTLSGTVSARTSQINVFCRPKCQKMSQALPILQNHDIGPRKEQDKGETELWACEGS
jgi:hypothetical protein